MFKVQKGSKNVVKKIIKLQLNHWCHMDYFNNVFTIFLGLEYCYTSNNILICVSKINKGLRFLEWHEGE